MPLASWLVIDWDQDQFHVLAVQAARRSARVTAALTWTHPEPFIPGTAERVGKALRDFLKTEKVDAAPVIVGIGRDRILLKELRFPPIALHEEAALVRFQTAKELTEAADHYAIDYVHLHTDSGPGERQIMTVAARRDIVAMLQTMCQAAGLKLHAVTPRLFGVASALAHAVQPDASPLGPTKRTVVLTLGQRWAELCFFRGEQLIQAQALANGPLLLSEVKRNLAVFQAQHAVEIDVAGPECLYVFGDDPNVLASLQSGLSVPAVILDPLGPESRGGVATKTPGAFAGAIGLALVWSQTKAGPVNLASPKKHQAPVSVSRQRVVFYGATAAAVLLVVAGSMLYVLATKKAEVAALTRDKADKKELLDSAAQERANLDAYKEWEQTTIPWLDEVYDLTARFPSVQGFHLNSLSAQYTATTTAKKGLKDAKEKDAKDGFSPVSVINLKGSAAPGKDESAILKQLNSSMSGDPHLRASIGRLNGNEFEMKIDVAKQSTAKYDTHLKVPPPLTAPVVAPTKQAEAQGDEE